MQLAIEHRARGTGAVPQAVHRLETETSVFTGLTQRQAEPAFQLSSQRLDPHRLASLGLTQLEHLATWRCSAEIVIETDHPMHLGTRQAQVLGNWWQQLGWYGA